MTYNRDDAVPANLMSRRTFLRLSGLAGGAAFLAACAGQGTTGATQEQAPAATEGEAAATEGEAPAADATTIGWWNQYSTDVTKIIIPQIVEQFQEMNPGITVDYEISGGPPGGGDYVEVLLTRIAAGTPPDSITLWSPPSQFGARGSLLAIDDFMSGAKLAKPEAFYEGPLKSCQWQGKTYGLPASAGAGCIFINTDKFTEKNLPTSREDFPTTWADLEELSAQFTVQEGDTITEAGFVPWTTGWLKPVWSALNGGKIFDAEANQYTVDSEQNIELLNYWLSYLDNQYGGDFEQFNLFGSWSGDVYPESAFQLGQTPMGLGGSWGCTDAAIPFGWEVVKLPVGPQGAAQVTGFYPNWWAVPTGSPHPAEAFLFSEHFSTVGWEIWYRAIMDTPAWRDFPADVLTEKLVEEQGQERAQDIHNFFATYLEDTADMWNSPIEDFASDTLDAAIDEVLHKTKTPAEALAEVQTLVQARLEETIKA